MNVHSFINYFKVEPGAGQHQLLMNRDGDVVDVGCALAVLTDNIVDGFAHFFKRWSSICIGVETKLCCGSFLILGVKPKRKLNEKMTWVATGLAGKSDQHVIADHLAELNDGLVRLQLDLALYLKHFGQGTDETVDG